MNLAIDNLAAFCRHDLHRNGAALAGALLLCGPVAAGVQIEGVNDELETNVLAHLSIDELPCDAIPDQVTRLFRQSKRQIRNAAEALGYYNVEITAALNQEGSCWEARFDIAPGEPVRIRELEIAVQGAANSDPKFQELLADTGLTVGQQFRHDDYENLKSRIVLLASRRGYADAVLLENNMAVYTEQRAVDIKLILESGERYSFGEVRFEQDVVTPALARRYIPFQRGEAFSNTKISDLYGALAGSGYFEYIQVEPLLEERANGEIPVAVKMTAANSRIYSVGAGFTTNTGPRMRANYTNRRINERGHQWGSAILASKVVSEATVNYRLPLADPTVEWLSFDAGLKREDTDTSESDAFQTGARKIKMRRYNWQETLFLDFLVENFEIGDQRDSSTLLTPGVSWQRVESDNRLWPERGYRLFFEVRGSSDKLGSDTSFVRFDSRAKWVQRLWPTARLILRGELGASLIDSFTDLPPSVRFFAGGDTSVRGYDYESLGPVDEDGEVIGGKNKLVGSVEVEQQITAKNSVALFVDSGNAGDDFDFDMQTGVGIGYRWQSPIGPLRIDLAKPLGNARNSVRLHITFGPDL